MPSDIRAQRAREEHLAASRAIADADAHRAERDRYILSLRTESPELWTYEALAAAVGCSPETIAAVVKQRTRRQRRGDRRV